MHGKSSGIILKSSPRVLSVMNWLAIYREDIRRYVDSGTKAGLLKQMLTHRELWALLQYRMASAIYRWAIPATLKRSLLFVMAVWQKFIQFTTGIYLPCTATIGPGLYIGHFGNITLDGNVIIGSNCNLLQGVSIVVSGRGECRGVPVIGDRVHLGVNATIAGKIRVGDNTTIAANSLVISDVPDGCSVAGIPAEIVGRDYPRYFFLEA